MTGAISVAPHNGLSRSIGLGDGYGRVGRVRLAHDEAVSRQWAFSSSSPNAKAQALKRERTPSGLRLGES
jgi:hypothetical protein